MHDIQSHFASVQAELFRGPRSGEIRPQKTSYFLLARVRFRSAPTLRRDSRLVHSVPKKIAFCITDLDPGGAERALVQLVTRLDRARFDPHVFCLSPAGELVGGLQSADIPVTCLNARRRWDVGVVWRLSRQLKRLRPDLLQTFLFNANVAGRLAGRWAGVPRIVSGIRVAEQRRNFHLSLDRWTQWMVAKHVCVSQAVADHARRRGRLDPSKLCVIPNGVDFDRFANAKPLDLGPWNIKPGDQVWVTVARLDEQKGPWDLLAAVEALHPRHPELKLLWAGTGPLQAALQQWIVAHHLNDVIQLMGWQSDIAGFFKAAQGFVLASRWEGMPNVVLEALAAGLPVIATKVEGVSEIITDGETGWVVAPADPTDPIETISARWDAVLRDPQRSITVALAGQQRVRDHFSWDLMAQRYMDLYDDLLGAGK